MFECVCKGRGEKVSLLLEASRDCCEFVPVFFFLGVFVRFFLLLFCKAPKMLLGMELAFCDDFC